MRVYVGSFRTEKKEERRLWRLGRQRFAANAKACASEVTEMGAFLFLLVGESKLFAVGVARSGVEDGNRGGSLWRSGDW